MLILIALIHGDDVSSSCRLNALKLPSKYQLKQSSVEGKSRTADMNRSDIPVRITRLKVYLYDGYRHTDSFCLVQCSRYNTRIQTYGSYSVGKGNRVYEEKRE